jgi:hypothetical protein
MTPDPDLYGPPDYQPDEDPSPDDDDLWDQAARDQAEQDAMAAEPDRGPGEVTTTQQAITLDKFTWQAGDD